MYSTSLCTTNNQCDENKSLYFIMNLIVVILHNALKIIKRRTPA